MQKIAILGSGGAGKSTLARQLGEQLNLEVIHLDQLFWKPGWVMATKDEQKVLYQPMLEKSSWIIDGNYSSTWDVRLQEADTVIYLDFSRYLCAYRILKRWWQYRNRTRPDMAEGNPERISWEFLKWVWNYPTTNRPAALAKLKSLPENKRVIILRNSKEVKNFLDGITSH